jgi:hypothetical protein
MQSLFRKLLILRFAQSFVDRFIHQRKPNRWKGLVLGAAGGAAGTLAMGYFLQAMASLSGSSDSGESSNSARAWHALDDISLLGKHYHDDESSTAALGRIIYQTLAGKEPEQETKTAMSQIVHWSFGTSMGALYGAIRGHAGIPDATGGALFGSAVWLFASELMIPLLGLSSGPTTSPAQAHANYLGGHIVYGVTTATVTQLLHRIL